MLLNPSLRGSNFVLVPHCSGLFFVVVVLFFVFGGFFAFLSPVFLP